METYACYCDKCGKRLSIYDEEFERRKVFTVEYPKYNKLNSESYIERQEKSLDLCLDCFLKLQQQIKNILESEVRE